MRLRQKLMLLAAVPLICNFAFVALQLFDLNKMHSALRVVEDKPKSNFNDSNLAAEFDDFCTKLSGLLYLNLLTATLCSAAAVFLLSQKLEKANEDESEHLVNQSDRIQTIPSSVSPSQVLSSSQVFSLRSMSRKVPDVICAVNLNLDIVSVNPACLTQWEYRQEELVGRNIAGVISANTVEATSRGLVSCKNTDSMVNFENEIICGSGRLVETRWSVSWSKTDQMYCCVVHDISEIKALERMKREFVQMIHHDLRTPLTSVTMTLNMLLEGVYGTLDPRSDQVLRKSSDNIKRVINLINELLDIERMEEGKLELHIRKASLTDVIDRSLNSVEGFARLNQVKLEKDIADSLLECDDERLVQVVINLLSNAIKYSGKGTTVNITSKLQGNKLLVMVRDQGPGIPADKVDQLFTRFKQLGTTPDTPVGSSGLGLAICKVIVDAHKGEIGVDSQVGNGSCFWFSLPLQL